MTNTPEPPIPMSLIDLREVLLRIATVRSAGAIALMVENASMKVDAKLALELLDRIIQHPTPDSAHAFSLLQSVCTPLDHNLEIQPGCATHRCIQAFLSGEQASEIRYLSPDGRKDLEEMIADKLEATTPLKYECRTNYMVAANCVMDTIHPYLRTTEPLPESWETLATNIREIISSEAKKGGSVFDAVDAVVSKLTEGKAPVPVSVSLEGMLKVFDEGAHGKGCCKKHRIQAVLDAAGVKYVD